MSTKKDAGQTRFIVAIALFSAALISALALTALGNRTETYWVADISLIPGSEISESDLSEVEVALGGASDKYLSRDANVSGSFVLRSIQKGELISTSSVSDRPATPKSGEVPISVRTSDLPDDIELGEMVNIYWVPEIQGMDKNKAPELVISGAFIKSINRKAENFGNQISLTLSVDEGEVVALLDATASGRLVVVRSNG